MTEDTNATKQTFELYFFSILIIHVMFKRSSEGAHI